MKYIKSFKDYINLQESVNIDKIEKYADKVMHSTDVEFTKHFYDQLTRAEHSKEITDAELIGFFKRLAKNKKEFEEFKRGYDQFVVKDERTEINIPFKKRVDQIIAKTVMRKSDFKTSNATYTFENFINERIRASDAYTAYSAVQTVIDGKRDLAFISTMDNPIYRLNNEEELAAMAIGLENGLKAIEVKGKPDGKAWVMYKNNKKAAQKLADYAEKKGGYLSDDTPEEARYIGDLLGYDKKDIKAFIKRVYKVDETEARVDLKDEDDRLMKIRHFQGSIQDLDDWLRSRIGETNPHKDVIMINGPQQGQKDKSLPYQDFQNGESDLVNNRYGRKDS